MKTIALQLHYTSCRRGMRGGKGFQTRRLSDGVRPDEQIEIQTLGGYTVPRTLQPEATPDEIARHFPVIYRSYQLGSGRFALTRSQYTGQDYSERWGNYFAHTLITEEPLPHWPIDYFEWPEWKTLLRPEEDTEDDSVVAPLPALALDAVEPAESFTFEELKLFLNEVPGRTEALAAMLQAVFLAPDASRAVVIRDTVNNGLFWIACIQKAFSAPLGSRLSTSTYQFEARNCADVNATTTGTEFTFDDTQRRFRFFMFDMLGDSRSEVPMEGADYAMTVARWMSSNLERLQKFLEFTRGLDESRITPSLALPLELFRLGIGENPGLADSRLLEALDYTLNHLPSAQLGRLVAVIAQAATAAAVGGNAEMLPKLFGFSKKFLTGTSEFESRIADAWLAVFDLVLEQRHWAAGAAVAQSLGILGKTSPRVQTSLADALLSEARLERIVAAFARPTAVDLPGLEYNLGCLLEAQRARGTSHPWATPECAQLISAVSARARSDAATATSLFRALDLRPEAIAHVARLLVIDPEHDPDDRGGEARGKVIGNALRNLLRSVPSSESKAVVTALDQTPTWPVLMGYFRAIRDDSTAARKLFAECDRLLLGPAPSFSRVHRGDIAAGVLDVLEAQDAAEAREQALEWVQNGERFSDEAQQRCLELASLAIEWTPNDEASLRAAKAVAHAAARREIVLKPNRPLLRELLEVAAEPHEDLSKLRLGELTPAVTALAPHDYTKFIDVFLPLSLQSAASGSDHQRLLSALYVEDRRESFAKSCAHALSATSARALSPAATCAALGFWLVETPPFTAMRATMLAAITERLVVLPRDQFEEVAAAIERTAQSSEAATWRAIREKVEDETRSALGKFARRLFQPKKS